MQGQLCNSKPDIRVLWRIENEPMDQVSESRAAPGCHTVLTMDKRGIHSIVTYFHYAYKTLYPSNCRAALITGNLQAIWATHCSWKQVTLSILKCMRMPVVAGSMHGKAAKRKSGREIAGQTATR